jgi:zinc-binding in reverse transcriptase
MSRLMHWGASIYDNSQPRSIDANVPHTHAHLHIELHTITYTYALRIRNAECDPPMIQYLKNKYKWSDDTFEQINWEVHGKAIRSQRHRKTHMTKLVHDLLPTNQVQHRWNSQHSDRCALCQREEETRDHLMRCEKSGDWRSNCLRLIGMKCEELRTH